MTYWKKVYGIFFLDILNCITECHPFVSKYEPSLTEMFLDLLSLRHQRACNGVILLCLFNV